MKFSINQLPSHKKFSYFFTMLFDLIALYLLSIEVNIISYGLSGMAFFFLFVTLLDANILLPLNKLWAYIGLLLGTIISPIVLGIIYLEIFTPVSLLMKLFRPDELSLKFEDKKTYWKSRELRLKRTIYC